jgi:hypothetical protein
MKSVSDNSNRENQNTYFMFDNIFSENHAVYEMSTNVVEPQSPQMTSHYGAYTLHAR